MAVISLPLRFSISPSNRCVNMSTLSSLLLSPLPPSLLDTHSLTTSSLECNALCLVINLLVLWSSSSLFHFKNSPEYLTTRADQVFIPLTRFLPEGFVWNNYLALLRYSFKTFFFYFHLFDGVSFLYPQVFVGFLFLWAFWLQLDLVVWLLSLWVVSIFHF